MLFNKQLAKAIYDVQNASLEVKNQWAKQNKRKWDLLGRKDLYMSYSDDKLCIYVWKINRFFKVCLKILPAFELSKKQIQKILTSQYWEVL